MVHTGGDTVREIRDYLKNIVNSVENDNYNYTIEETIDLFRDKLDREKINSAADYRKRLDEATLELRKINEEYNKTVSRQNCGKNVDNFISEVSEILNTLKDINRGDGLTGNLQCSNFSKDQLSEIRDMLVDINLISADLIEVYENEL